MRLINNFLESYFKNRPNLKLNNMELPNGNYYFDLYHRYYSLRTLTNQKTY